MTDTDGVTVSNGYADNNAPYDVATKTIANKRFQKVILYDGSGNEVTSWTITPSGTQDVNLTKVGGVATSLGQKAMTASIPAVIASDQASTASEAGEFATTYGLVVGGVTKDGVATAYCLPISTGGAAVVGTIVGALPSGTNLLGGVSIKDATNTQTVAVLTSAPSGAESGIVARIIPSGIQAISRTVNSATLDAYGKIAGSSLTTSYQDLLVMSGDAAVLRLFNSTEVPVIISLDAGSTDCEELGPYENISIDYYANDLILPADTIRVKLVSGSAPTNGGSVRASVTR